MLKAAVIGDPVSHSLSPRVHGWWLKAYGIEGSYEAIRVEGAELGAFLKSLPERGFEGCNITIPHKELALASLDYIDESAEMVGAVNTIAVREGKLFGRNTDVYGFVTYLKQAMVAPDLLAGRKAVVIGAGGAARAICAGLLGDLQVQELVLLNRTHAKAEAIRDHFATTLRAVLARDSTHTPAEIEENIAYFLSEVTIGDWENKEASLEDAALVVNTSALGMVGQPALELDLSPLSGDAVVADIVFNPLETRLLRSAAARDLVAVDGLGMLLHQAAPGFKMWFDPDDKLFKGLPQVTDAQRAYVLEGLIK